MKKVVQMEEKRLSRIEVDVVELKTKVAVAESNIKEIKQDIDGIKDNTTWILRLVVGGIIGAILAFIYSGGLNL